MRICNREEFLKLPKGVLYQKSTAKWAWEGELLIKGETFKDHNGNNIDFLYYTIIDTWVEVERDNHRSSIEDVHDTWYDMLENKKEYLVASVENRDGFFDDDNLFMIFDDDDRRKIREMI